MHQAIICYCNTGQNSVPSEGKERLATSNHWRNGNRQLPSVSSCRTDAASFLARKDALSAVSNVFFVRRFASRLLFGSLDSILFLCTRGAWGHFTAMIATSVSQQYLRLPQLSSEEHQRAPFNPYSDIHKRNARIVRVHHPGSI